MHLSNQQWEAVAPLIPKPAKKDRRGRPRRNGREILNGMLWVLRTGAPWKDLPRDTYPPYQTCHRRFQEWSRDGTFVRLLRAIAEDMQRRGKLSLEECLLMALLRALKKGVLCWKNETWKRHEKHGNFRPKLSSNLHRCGVCFSARSHLGGENDCRAIYEEKSKTSYRR